MACEFVHFGVPTTVSREGESYVAGGKVFVTDPDANPFKIEFLRFEADSPMPEAIQQQSHAAYKVDDMAKALEGRNVIVEPFEAMPGLTVAFITDGEAVIELMEQKCC